MNLRQAFALVIGAGATFWIVSFHGHVGSLLTVWNRYRAVHVSRDPYIVEAPFWQVRLVAFTLAVVGTLATVYFLRTKRVEE